MWEKVLVVDRLGTHMGRFTVHRFLASVSSSRASVWVDAQNILMAHSNAIQVSTRRQAPPPPRPAREVLEVAPAQQPLPAIVVNVSTPAESEDISSPAGKQTTAVIDASLVSILLSRSFLPGLFHTSTACLKSLGSINVTLPQLCPPLPMCRSTK